MGGKYWVNQYAGSIHSTYTSWGTRQGSRYITWNTEGPGQTHNPNSWSSKFSLHYNSVDSTKLWVTWRSKSSKALLKNPKLNICLVLTLVMCKEKDALIASLILGRFPSLGDLLLLTCLSHTKTFVHCSKSCKSCILEIRPVSVTHNLHHAFKQQTIRFRHLQMQASWFKRS